MRLTPEGKRAIKSINLHWHDLRHEKARRLWKDGAGIRTIQLMLGHTTTQQTQRYLNITDDELKARLQPVFEKRRERMKLVSRV